MIAESTAHAAKSYLEGAGYSPEFHVYDMGHEISGEVIRDLVAWDDSRPAAAGRLFGLRAHSRGHGIRVSPGPRGGRSVPRRFSWPSPSPPP